MVFFGQVFSNELLYIRGFFLMVDEGNSGPFIAYRWDIRKKGELTFNFKPNGWELPFDITIKDPNDYLLSASLLDNDLRPAETPNTQKCNFIIQNFELDLNQDTKRHFINAQGCYKCGNNIQNFDECKITDLVNLSIDHQGFINWGSLNDQNIWFSAEQLTN